MTEDFLDEGDFSLGVSFGPEDTAALERRNFSAPTDPDGVTALIAYFGRTVSEMPTPVHIGSCPAWFNDAWHIQSQSVCVGGRCADDRHGVPSIEKFVDGLEDEGDRLHFRVLLKEMSGALSRPVVEAVVHPLAAEEILWFAAIHDGYTGVTREFLVIGHSNGDTDECYERVDGLLLHWKGTTLSKKLAEGLELAPLPLRESKRRCESTLRAEPAA